ncbi:MAG: hypothetical protein AAFN10_25620 [Bacteroidota bacterium]
MYQINNFSSRSSWQQTYQAQPKAVILSHILSQKLSYLLVLMGMIFPSMGVLAGGVPPTSNSTGSSAVGIGNANYLACNGCGNGAGLNCGDVFDSPEFTFALSSAGGFGAMVTSISVQITSPSGASILPYYGSFGNAQVGMITLNIPNGSNSVNTSIPIPSNYDLVLEGNLDFILPCAAGGSADDFEEGDYHVVTTISGFDSYGIAFTAYVNYTLDIEGGNTVGSALVDLQFQLLPEFLQIAQNSIRLYLGLG